MLLLLNFNRNGFKTMSVFPFLCHRVMTFNQEYYYTPLVTAETQNQPADAIPVLLLAAYKRQLQTGSCLTLCTSSENTLQNKACRQTANAFQHVSQRFLEPSKFPPIPVAKGSLRKKVFYIFKCSGAAVARCEAT